MDFFHHIQDIVRARIAPWADDAFATTPPQPLTVQLVGEADHADFRDAIEIIRSHARIVDDATAPPELIVLAQSRPDVIGRREVELLRRSVPLAGIVGLMGTWCEGETRTGRPWPGVTRLYWYEFPAWWRRQLRLRAAGRCPDWARCGDVVLTDIRSRRPLVSRGVVELCVPTRETADVLADVLQSVGYATVWHRRAEAAPVVRGIVAGIWDGGQLNEQEANALNVFCRRLQRQQAPVIALLDFPRRDRVDYAMELGATAVFGKPWMNWALIDAIESATSTHNIAKAA